ncbi:hypothetical protein CYY_000390 [Polysphondylium violaceum]|uniref:Zinc/iron permease n=1 Tax=Polysphondylium violaceum TaxID=133409 RepID=A0A8J4V5M2_9MYCE|nr:hypothetical protein CYY_000390 [Polysphondylium violaceum]
MTGSVFTFSILAGLAPLVSASITYFALRGKKNTANSSLIFHVLLCFSVGLLFAVATLELIPESIDMSLNDSRLKQPDADNHSPNDEDHDDKHHHEQHNTDNDHGDGDGGHSHGQDIMKHSMRIPMYGLAFGFVVLILIESFFSNDGGHSHSHLMSSPEKDDDHQDEENDHDHDHHHLHEKEHKYKPIDSNDTSTTVVNNDSSNSTGNSSNSNTNNNNNNSNNDSSIIHNSNNNPLSPNLNISNDSNIDHEMDNSSGNSSKKNRRKTSSDSPTTKDDVNIVIVGENNVNKSASASASKISFTTFIALCIHSFVDGAVISSAFTSSASVGARVAIAIVVHKIPDGLVLSSIILSNKNIFSLGSTYNNPFYYFLIVSSMTPIGSFIAGVLFGGLSMSSVSFVLGFGAGTFLYITSTALLPEILTSNVKKSTSLISIICGYIVFIILDSLFHGAH